MGGDGGSISQRSEMVKTRKKAAKEVDPTDEAISAWTLCSMTAEALRRPIMVCEMGRLYNKSSVLAHLLALKSKDPATPKPAYAFSHIKSMKHVTEAKLHYDDESKVGKGSDPHVPICFSCPITGIPGNGKRRFVVIHGCGCVMSEKAIEQVPSTVCLICGRQLKNGQIVLDKRFSTEESAVAMGLSSSGGGAGGAAAAEEVGTVGAGAEKKVPKVTPQDLEREYTPILPADPRESDLLREILLAKRAQAKGEKASGKKRGREGKEEAAAGTDEQKGEGETEGGEQRPSKRSKKEKEAERRRREEEWKESQERQKEWRSLKEKPIKELAAAVEQAVNEKMRSSAFAELFTSDKDRVGLTPNLTGAGIAHKPRR